VSEPAERAFDQDRTRVVPPVDVTRVGGPGNDRTRVAGAPGADATRVALGPDRTRQIATDQLDGLEITRHVSDTPDRDGAGLPGDLERQWQVVRELSVGGEATLFGVCARDGEDDAITHVVKIYQTDFDNRRRGVWAVVKGIHHPHLLPLVATGASGGHDYEVAPFFAAGTLDDLMGPADSFTPWSPDRIKVVVRQVGAALNRLHREQVLHRDVKPGNLLLRSAEPLSLVLADFGISRVLDTTGVHTNAAGTLRYQGPESQVAGQVWDSPARDWWALGIIVLELARGQRLLRGVKEEVLIGRIAIQGVSTEGVNDARIKLLCDGLLTRDYRYRWGSDEVKEWLRGGSPRVKNPEPERIALPFLGKRYTDPVDLADAICADEKSWNAVERRFLTYIADQGSKGEGWRQLEVWLRSTRRDADEAMAELVDHHLRPAGVEKDAKIFQLVRWLDPASPPRFRGQVLDPARLQALAVAAESDARASVQVGALGRSRVLALLDTAADGSAATPAELTLHAVGRRWAAADKKLATRPKELTRGTSAMGKPVGFSTDERRRTALLLAADPLAAEQTLRNHLRQANRDMDPWAPDWWKRMVRRVPRYDQRDPAAEDLDAALDRAVSLTVLRQFLPMADQEAQARRRQDEAAKLRAQQLQRQWDDEERRRTESQVGPLLLALLRVALWLALGVVLLIWHGRAQGEIGLFLTERLSGATVRALMLPWTSTLLRVVTIGAFVLVNVVHFWQELSLASELGAEYRRPIASEYESERKRARRDQLDQLSRMLWSGSAGTRITRGSLTLTGIVATVVLLVAAPVLFLAVQLWRATLGVSRRRQIWRAAHEDHRIGILGTASASTPAAGGQP
jgi:hypothetical protein